MERKPLSKKTRFEVFKRDSFTCQYCGSKAPDVILEIDHIVPVAEGGTNDILNLITSCRNCNRGKGARTLSDKTAVERQRKQLDDLNEIREQTEMLIEWKQELRSVEETQIAAIDSLINDLRERSTRRIHDRAWSPGCQVADTEIRFPRGLYRDGNSNDESEIPQYRVCFQQDRRHLLQQTKGDGRKCRIES